MTEQQTLGLLVDLLDAREPFLHVRFGDGDVFFATGTGPVLTGDGEEWSFELSSRLRTAWRRCARYSHRLLLGDVESYDVDDGCLPQWRDMLREATAARGETPELVHIEALRAGRGLALPFYRALAADPRRKVFVGPERLASAAVMLRADHAIVPLRTAHVDAEGAALFVLGDDPRYEVAVFAAGRGGKIMQGVLAEHAPLLTQIDVGSGLDLLFDGVRRGTDAGVDVAALKAAYRDAGLTA